MESGTQASAYPVQLSVEYPDRDLDRVTTAFRLIWAIPILILVATIQGDPAAGWDDARTWQLGRAQRHSPALRAAAA